MALEVLGSLLLERVGSGHDSSGGGDRKGFMEERGRNGGGERRGND